MFYENGARCDVKAVEGSRRDNETDLLLDEDMTTLGLNDTGLANLTATPNMNPVKYAMYQDIMQMRLDELVLVTTGASDCISNTTGESMVWVWYIMYFLIND